VGQLELGVYALCLADRPDRRLAVERELLRVGLDHEVFEGTRPAGALGFSSPGRRGCFESHLALLRKGYDDGVDAVVICQDDLWIARSFPRFWPSIQDTIAATEWQFLNLGYVRNFYPSVDAQLERVGPHVARLLASDLLCAHFHAVHRSVIPDLIEFLEDILANGPHRPYDGSLNDFRRARGYFPLVSIPNLGEQRPSPSNITPSSNPFSSPLHHVAALRPALAGWRAARRVAFEIESRIGPRSSKFITPAGQPSPAEHPQDQQRDLSGDLSTEESMPTDPTPTETTPNIPIPKAQ